jgi:hypothetical protein
MKKLIIIIFILEGHVPFLTSDDDSTSTSLITSFDLIKTLNAFAFVRRV